MELIRNPKLTNVRMLDKFGGMPGVSSKSPLQCGLLGTLYLTATHLIFVDQNGMRETWILHSHLASIAKQAISTSGTPIHIRCKNFCSVTFVVPRERDAHELYTSLYQISQPIRLDDLYCFQYTASSEPFQNDRSLGWNKFTLKSEFGRQGVPNYLWQATTLNAQYELCDTYPSFICVPTSLDDPTIIASARFRSKNRLPVLSYFNKRNQAVICRCSQPLSGLLQRSPQDERLMQSILDANPNVPADGSRKCLYIVDTRPMMNAIANRAAGKGYENENFYENIKFNFFGIENIHVMRGSLQKLIETCELKVPSINAFLSGIQASGWLKHVRSVLETANFVAQTVESGVSVVVHCSDGWDRTAQTCSLAALLLDPYYRTIDGFQALIHKEWLSFGHKFNDRCGHIQIGDSKEVAPVFTQFVDAVWQLQQQYPFDFEFNERFLLTLHDHVYSCQFGTFIGNSEKERIDLQLPERTFSLWALFDTQRRSFINPLYSLKRNMAELTSGLDLDSATLRRLQTIREASQNESPLMCVNLCPQLIRFWRSMYNRFDVGVHPRESCPDLLSVSYNHILHLRSHIRYLESALADVVASRADFNSNKDNNVCESRMVSEDSFDGRISIRNDSSFDSIDSPLKVVQECMLRLQMQHEENRKQAVQDKESAKFSLNACQTIRAPIKHRMSSLDLAQILQTIENVSLHWQSVRNAKECSCGSPFDQANAMFHCWGCGFIFCVRCVEKRPPVSGHLDLSLLSSPSPVNVATANELEASNKTNNSVDPATLIISKGVGDQLVSTQTQIVVGAASESTDANFSLVQLGSMSLGQDPLTCVKSEQSKVVAAPPSSSSLSSPPSSSGEPSQSEASNIALSNQFVPICNKCSKLFAKN